MPVRKVGKDAYQWGKSGKIYRGANAKQKAILQGIAIEKSGYEEPHKRKKK